MLLIFSAAMLSVGALLVGWALVICRDPRTPRALTDGLVGDLLTVGIVALFSLGVALLAREVTHTESQALGALEVALALAVPTVIGVAWWRVWVRPRLAAIAAAARGTATVVVTEVAVAAAPLTAATANDDSPGPPTPRPVRAA